MSLANKDISKLSLDMIKLTTLSFESEIIGELAANNFLFPSNRYTMPSSPTHT